MFHSSFISNVKCPKFECNGNLEERSIQNHNDFAAAFFHSKHLGNPISIESSTHVDTDNDFSKH